jgi:hypothetical protein
MVSLAPDKKCNVTLLQLLFVVVLLATLGPLFTVLGAFFFFAVLYSLSLNDI